MTFERNLDTVLARIAMACATARRPGDSVQLLAVSKTVSAERLRAAAVSGLQAFGESYVQEALPKLSALADLSLTWHYIGAIQSNKTAEIAAHFDWVHGVDRLKIAERLSAQRPAQLPPLNVCVQVNISGEASKSGCAPAGAAALCHAIAKLPSLKLRGLMALPAPSGGCEPFRLLNTLFESLQNEMPGFDTLSMGMSDDLEDAIAEGSTLVRVGTGLFGERAAGKPSPNAAS